MKTGDQVTRSVVRTAPGAMGSVKAGANYAGTLKITEEAKAVGGEPIFDLVARYLRAQKTIAPRRLNLPKIEGVAGNPGIA